MVWLALVVILLVASVSGAALAVVAFRGRAAVRQARVANSVVRAQVSELSKDLTRIDQLGVQSVRRADRMMAETEQQVTRIEQQASRIEQALAAIDVELKKLRDVDQRLGSRQSNADRRAEAADAAISDLRRTRDEQRHVLVDVGTQVQRLIDQQRSVAADAARPSQRDIDGDFSSDASPSTLSVARQQLSHALDVAASVPLEPASRPTSLNYSALLPQGDGPQVAVIVTSDNSAGVLRRCLLSVQQQSLPTFECIIVDDASTDDSLRIADLFVADDDRFRVVRLEQRQGRTNALNVGLQGARAPFIAFVDAESFLLRSSLEQRLFTFLGQTDPAVAGVFSGVESGDESMDLAEWPDDIEWNNGELKDFVSTGGEQPFGILAPLVRVDVLRHAGSFDDSVPAEAAAAKTWSRLLRNGFVFVPCRASLAIDRSRLGEVERSALAAVRSELLAASEEPADESVRMSAAPFFHPLPAAHSREAIDQTVQSYRRMASASLSETNAQVLEALEALPVGMGPMTKRHVDRRQELLNGLRTGLGLSEGDFSTVQPEARRVERRLSAVAASREWRPEVPKLSLPVATAHASRDPISLYHWNKAEVRGGGGNFGDELSPLLVELVSGRSVEAAGLEECDLIGVGSVLESTKRTSDQRPAVWGSGFMYQGRMSGAHLDVHAVRGRLTQARCGGRGALGDPGLLSRYLDHGGAEEFRVGLIPHFVDWEHPFCQQFVDHVDGAVLISPVQRPLDVLAQISGCDVVFSSSLHGLICADSLGVPNAWVELSDGVLGSGYKFADYYSSFNIVPTPLRPVDPQELDGVVDDVVAAHARPELDRLCAGLIDAFPSHL